MSVSLWVPERWVVVLDLKLGVPISKGLIFELLSVV